MQWLQANSLFLDEVVDVAVDDCDMDLAAIGTRLITATRP